MSGGILLLPLYAFVEWTGKILPLPWGYSLLGCEVVYIYRYLPSFGRNCYCSLQCLRILLCLSNSSSTFCRDAGSYLPNYVASLRRRQTSSYLLEYESEISHVHPRWEIGIYILTLVYICFIFHLWSGPNWRSATGGRIEVGKLGGWN